MKLPRMNGGNLVEEIKRRKSQNLFYSESELIKHFYALVCGVDYLHKKKIFHGDIKVNNILLDDEGNMKLSDIGSAKSIEDEDLFDMFSGSDGAVLYKAPEIIKHERALQESDLKIEDERKAFLMESLLKKENLFLADAWSLGLTLLEICLLKVRLVHLNDPEERLQKLRAETSQRYQSGILNLLFGLLKVDPKERLRVSTVKLRLEEDFGEILANGGGFQKASGNLEIFKEMTEKMMRVFEENQKIKEEKLNLCEERIEKLQIEIEKIKIQQRKNEEIIQVLKQENLSLLEKLQEQTNPIKDLQKKWDKWFEISGEDYVSIQARETLTITDDILNDFTEDLVQECSKQKLWGKMERLEIQIDGPKSLTDQGLKTFSSQLGPKLSNIRYLVLDMDSWEGITDEGLKEFSMHVCPKLRNVQYLELDMGGWDQITDEGIKIFASRLGPQLLNIKSLILGMDDGNQITDDGLKALTSQLAPKITKTERLILGMNNWSLITNNGLKILTSQVLSQLASVRNLELDMGEWSQITDEGLEIFALQLGPQLNKVESLVLGMHSWRVFALKLISRLENGIIEHFDFDMGDWNRVTDKGLREFVSKLCDVSHLELNVSNLKKITSQGGENIVLRIVQKMASLEELGLYLGEAMKDNLKNKFKGIPKVHIS